MKRIVSILALFLLICAAFTVMVGCENDADKDPVYQDYTITIVDGLGNPIRDVIVKIHTPGGEVKNRVGTREWLGEVACHVPPSSLSGLPFSDGQCPCLPQAITVTLPCPEGYHLQNIWG